MSRPGPTIASMSRSKCFVPSAFTRTMITLPVFGGSVRRNLRELGARLVLARLVDRILEVERERIGLARHRLGEELRAATGNEKL